jgi:8-oxo-dGTP pyrophosphatase MutT (NUDIX family)
MLLFYRATAQDPNPETLAEEGLSPNGRSSIRLWQKLEDVPAGAGPTLVVDTRALPENERSDDVRSLRVPTVPPDALCNAAPYRSPQSVSAGGGYVGCALPDDVALLLIFRRGVWDLPKGTKESDESIVTCARREVGEEVGVDTITVLRNLGTTRHGYPDEDRYVVKTTHWYLMQTPERFFEPDRQEGIQHVARARWPVARKHLGYASLRRHMDRVKEDVYTVLVP